MGTEALIQVYVARADLFICSALRALRIVAYISLALGAIILVIHGVRLWR